MDTMLIRKMNMAAMVLCLSVGTLTGAYGATNKTKTTWVKWIFDQTLGDHVEDAVSTAKNTANKTNKTLEAVNETSDKMLTSIEKVSGQLEQTGRTIQQATRVIIVLVVLVALRFFILPFVHLLAEYCGDALKKRFVKKKKYKRVD